MNKQPFINYTREAFLHPANLGLLFGATTSAFFVSDALASPLILTLSFGLELIYLGSVPKLASFRKKIKTLRLKEKEPVLENKNVFNVLNDENRQRFLVLKHLSLKIEKNFEKLPYTTQGLLESIKQKTNGLLNNYLNLLDVNQRHRDYIGSSQHISLQQEIDALEAELKGIESEALLQKKERRLQILKKRLHRFATAKERYEITETELETIEDAVQYIFEQSMTMNNPEEIGFQLDTLLSEVEETSSFMNEMDSTSVDDFGLLDKKEDILDSSLETESLVSPKKVRN